MLSARSCHFGVGCDVSRESDIEDLVFAESAITDLKSIKAWQGAPEIGDRIIERTASRIEALLDHPEAGRPVSEFDQLFQRDLMFIGATATMYQSCASGAASVCRAFG